MGRNEDIAKSFVTTSSCSVNIMDRPSAGLGAELSEDTQLFHVPCHNKCPFVQESMSLDIVIPSAVLEVTFPIWTA